MRVAIETSAPPHQPLGARHMGALARVTMPFSWGLRAINLALQGELRHERIESSASSLDYHCGRRIRSGCTSEEIKGVFICNSLQSLMDSVAKTHFAGFMAAVEVVIAIFFSDLWVYRKVTKSHSLAHRLQNWIAHGDGHNSIVTLQHGAGGGYPSHAMRWQTRHGRNCAPPRCVAKADVECGITFRRPQCRKGATQCGTATPKVVTAGIRWKRVADSIGKTC